jgi:hypothetical protein
LTIIATKVRFREATFPHLVAHLELVPVFHTITILHDSKALEVSQGERVALRQDVVAPITPLFIIALQEAPRRIWLEAAGGGEWRQSILRNIIYNKIPWDMVTAPLRSPPYLICRAKG